jgi:DNA (cytosine-5)-methyltransferase 1
MAGYRVVYANEFVEAARETYRANANAATFLDDLDIRDVTPERLLMAAGVARGELDLLDGSPPCASFSTAGKREKAWGEVKSYSDTKQRADDLFFEFARLLDGVQPKVFVAENVSGLVKGTAKGYFLEILAALKACGYRVTARLLDAQWLGVPQARERLIFVGVRNDLGLDPVHPKPLPYRYSIRDALPWISAVRGGNKAPFDSKGKPYDLDKPSAAVLGGDTLGLAPYQFEVDGPPERIVGIEVDRRTAKFGKNAGGIYRPSVDEPCDTITANGAGGDIRTDWKFVVEKETDISRYAVGAEWEKIGVGGQSEKYFQLVRPDADGPSPTITAAGGYPSLATVTHPTEKRKFSIPELRRLCGFPDDFIVTGSYAQQWERLGRAVPPVMMSHIAATIRDGILKREKTGD